MKMHSGRFWGWLKTTISLRETLCLSANQPPLVLALHRTFLVHFLFILHTSVLEGDGTGLRLYRHKGRNCHIALWGLVERPKANFHTARCQRWSGNPQGVRGEVGGAMGQQTKGGGPPCSQASLVLLPFPHVLLSASCPPSKHVCISWCLPKGAAVPKMLVYFVPVKRVSQNAVCPVECRKDVLETKAFLNTASFTHKGKHVKSLLLSDAAGLYARTAEEHGLLHRFCIHGKGQWNVTSRVGGCRWAWHCAGQHGTCGRAVAEHQRLLAQGLARW